MAVYKAMAYLPESVESILNQTFTDFEFIIVNDGSTDESTDYLNSLTDPRIVLLHQKNAGQQAAANKAIQQAKAPYIARMDADDLAEPVRFEKQVAFLDANPEVGLVGSQIYRLGGNNRGLGSSFPCDHDKLYEELINNRHAMCNPTIMFRKQLFQEIGGYWEHNIAEDWDMFLRIGEISKLANLPEPLLSYRFHTGSINGRRMFEAQLHNEYACELARRRNRGNEEITFDEFRKTHKSSRWPFSWIFRMDCKSVAEYRIAIAEVDEGRKIRGALRLGFACLCSPVRTFERIARVFKFKQHSA